MPTISPDAKQAVAGMHIIYSVRYQNLLQMLEKIY